MQEVAGERGGYLHGRGALDSDDLLYLKEQMEAEEDAERLLRRTEKRAFAAFKRAASLADSSPAPAPLPLRVEPKPKSGISDPFSLPSYSRTSDFDNSMVNLTSFLRTHFRCHHIVEPVTLITVWQEDLLKKVGVRPKRSKLSSSLEDNQPTETPSAKQDQHEDEAKHEEKQSPSTSNGRETSASGRVVDGTAKSLLGLAYESSDSED